MGVGGILVPRIDERIARTPRERQIVALLWAKRVATARLADGSQRHRDELADADLAIERAQVREAVPIRLFDEAARLAEIDAALDETAGQCRCERCADERAAEVG